MTASALLSRRERLMVMNVVLGRCGFRTMQAQAPDPAVTDIAKPRTVATEIRPPGFGRRDA